MAALYRTITREILENKSHIFKSYFSAFKTNLRQCLVPGILFTLYGVVMAIELSNAWLGKSDYLISPYIWLFILLILLVFSMFLYAVISRIKAPFLAVLGLAASLMFQNAKGTFSLVAILVACGFILYFVPGCLILLPGIVMYVATLFIRPQLEKYISDTMES